jgi:hypothetical protein
MNDGKIINSGVRNNILFQQGHILLFFLLTSFLILFFFNTLYDYSIRPKWRIVLWPETITQILFGVPNYQEGSLLEFGEKLLLWRKITTICNIILFWIIYLLIGYKINQKFEKWRDFKYLPCPFDNCKKSVLIKLDWQCNNCNHFQGKPRYISDSCVHCKRELETVFCEHCHGEIRL